MKHTIAYSCDLCGRLKSSPLDLVQVHNENRVLAQVCRHPCSLQVQTLLHTFGTHTTWKGQDTIVCGLVVREGWECYTSEDMPEVDLSNLPFKDRSVPEMLYDEGVDDG